MRHGDSFAVDITFKWSRMRFAISTRAKAQIFLSEVSESGSRLVSAGELLPVLEQRQAA